MLSASTGPSAIATAIGWAQALVSGPFAVSLMTVAIALVGFGMLTGRIAFRRAAMVLLGCFLIVGSPEISSTLAGNDRISSVGIDDISIAPNYPAPEFERREPIRRTNPFDPY